MRIEACNSAIVVIDYAANLAANYQSPVIDFKDSSQGSIHVIYSGVTGVLGVFIVHGGLSVIPADMDDNDVDTSDFMVIKPGGSKLWEYQPLSWRYGQLRWAANGNTGGTAKILAMGKKT